jgi:hypothetical protein
MTSNNINTIQRKYFTKESEVKNSSLVEMLPNSIFKSNSKKQNEIYVAEGSIAIESKTYGSGTYISTNKQIEIKAINKVKLFIYQEPQAKYNLEIIIKPEQIKWDDSGIKGQKNSILRNVGHQLLIVLWEPNTKVPFHIHPYGEEIFVLSGELLDKETSIKKFEWVRMLPNTGHSPNTKEKTLILLRNGHL